MNSSPTTTGSVAITAGMITTVIVWALPTLFRIPAPPDAVAAALAAMALYGAHAASVWFSRRFPAPAAPAAPVAPPAPAQPSA